jgi:hypothetical protein
VVENGLHRAELTAARRPALGFGSGRVSGGEKEGEDGRGAVAPAGRPGEIPAVAPGQGVQFIFLMLLYSRYPKKLGKFSSMQGFKFSSMTFNIYQYYCTNR